MIWLFLPGERNLNPWVPFVILNVLPWIGIFLSLTGSALWGIHQRQPYGRWWSVVFLMILVVVGLASSDESGAIRIIFQALMQGQLPPIEGRLIDDFHDNSYPIYRGYLDLARHAVVNALSFLLWAGIPGFLAIRLVFSPEVKRFFSRS
jgi:hypothetical protein